MAHFNHLENEKTEKILVQKANKMQDRNTRTLSVNVGIVGILGGIIVLPLLIGILVGGWLDKNYALERISWRLNLMLVGFLVGLYYAYCWVKLEGIEKLEKMEKEYSKEKK